jgi:regulator of replication initiation timing
MNNFKDGVEKMLKKHIYNWDGYLSNAIIDISALHEKEIAEKDNQIKDLTLQLQTCQNWHSGEVDMNDKLIKENEELKKQLKTPTEYCYNEEAVADYKKQIDQLRAENEKLQESLGITIHWISQQKFPNKFELSKLTRKDK